MRFFNETKWQIRDPQVRMLDASRVRLNSYCSLAESQGEGDPFPRYDLVTARKIEYNATRIERKAERLMETKLAPFDKLILKDIHRNAKVARAYHGYFYDSNDQTRVGAFFSKIFSNGAFSEIQRAITPGIFPHDAVHEYDVASQPMKVRTLESFIILDRAESSNLLRRMHRKLETLLIKLKSEASNFYLDLGVLTQVSEYEAIYAIGPGFSYWDGVNLMIQVDPDRILCYKPSGSKDYQIFPGIGHIIAAHELAHGLKEILSRRTMPQGLAPGVDNFFYAVHMASSEGPSLVADDFALQHILDNPKKVGLSKKEAELLRKFARVYIPTKLPQAIHDLFNVKAIEERENPEYPVSLRREECTRLSKLTSIKRYLTDPYLFEDRDLGEALSSAAYYFGANHAGELVKDMRKQGVPDNTILLALFSGFWCDEQAQRQFIFEHFLPRTMGRESGSARVFSVPRSSRKDFNFSTGETGTAAAAKK